MSTDKTDKRKMLKQVNKKVCPFCGKHSLYSFQQDSLEQRIDHSWIQSKAYNKAYIAYIDNIKILS